MEEERNRPPEVSPWGPALKYERPLREEGILHVIPGQILKYGIGPGWVRHQDDAVFKALHWLSRNQRPDGSWEADSPEAIVGVTGLSLLAFLWYGYGHDHKGYGESAGFGRAVRHALSCLTSQQDVDGFVGKRGGGTAMWGHMIATLALCETVRLTHTYLVRQNARRAVDYMVAVQIPEGAWACEFPGREADPHVTAWAAMALWSAYSGVVTSQGVDCGGIRSWLRETWGRSGQGLAEGRTCIPGNRDSGLVYPQVIPLLLQAFLWTNCRGPREYVDWRDLLKQRPAWAGKGGVGQDGLLGTIAVMAYDGPSGPDWMSWIRGLKEALKTSQSSGGSWTPGEPTDGKEGSPYATAMNALAIEVILRHPSCLFSFRVWGAPPCRHAAAYP